MKSLSCKCGESLAEIIYIGSHGTYLPPDVSATLPVVVCSKCKEIVLSCEYYLSRLKEE